MSMPVEVKYYPGRKSRVVTSFMSFLFGSALNITRAFRDQAPLTFFMLFGSIPFVIGLIFLIFTGIHWGTTGEIFPYTSFGIAGLYSFTLGIIIWIVGLVADMLDRVINNQEKLLELSKRNIYKDAE